MIPHTNDTHESHMYHAKLKGGKKTLIWPSLVFLREEGSVFNPVFAGGLISLFITILVTSL